MTRDGSILRGSTTLVEQTARDACAYLPEPGRLFCPKGRLTADRHAPAWLLGIAAFGLGWLIAWLTEGLW